MDFIDDSSRPIALLNDRQFDKLQKKEKHARRLLRQGGMSKKQARNHVHRDISAVVERRSAASPYEAARAAHILRATVRNAGLSEVGAVAFTVAILQHRPAVGGLLNYDPAKGIRKFRQAFANLQRMGLRVRGVCILEIDLCRPLNSEPFYEAHLHGVIWGASIDQLKRAFIVRKLAKGAVRNRPKVFKEVYDLQEQLAYMTKIKPWLHFQKAGAQRGFWHQSPIPDADAHEWRMFMSRYRVRELLAFRGIDAGGLGSDGTSELVRDPRDLSSRRPKGGPRGPSRLRGRR